MNKYPILIFLSMIFAHVFDDFTLQGILASLKQKEWWKENAPDKKYRFDYIVALFAHSFSWAFMIHIPLIVANYSELDQIVLTVTMIFSVLSHCIVDTLKANVKAINLITDQILHLTNIAAVCFIWMSI